MTTMTEQIVEAISTRLRNAGLPVRDTDKSEPYSFESQVPCIVVDAGDEMRPPATGIGFYNWTLTVSLWIVAEGPTPKLAPEPLRAQAHVAVYSPDRTLGGLVSDISVTAVHRSTSEENPALGLTEAIYEIMYRTPEGVM